MPFTATPVSDRRARLALADSALGFGRVSSPFGVRVGSMYIARLIAAFVLPLAALLSVSNFGHHRSTRGAG